MNVINDGDSYELVNCREHTNQPHRDTYNSLP